MWFAFLALSRIIPYIILDLIILPVVLALAVPGLGNYQSRVNQLNFNWSPFKFLFILFSSICVLFIIVALVLLVAPFYFIADKFNILSDPDIILKPVYIFNYVMSIFVIGCLILVLQVKLTNFYFYFFLFEPPLKKHNCSHHSCLIISFVE